MRKLILSLTLLLSCAQLTKAQEGNSSGPEYLQNEAFAKMNLPFSQAVKLGNVLYLSGQLGNVNNSLQLAEGGIGPETRQTMENIKAVLETHGSSMDQVIKCTCMLADMAEWPAMNQVYAEYFPKNKPARSAFGASGLALGARVEIECMAYVK